MSDKPPTDDDPWKSVLDQVEVALDSLNLRTGSLGDALMDGVREALSGNFGVEIELDETGGPRVVVLDGGKADDATDEVPIDGPPDLRVVSKEDEDSSDKPHITGIKFTDPEVTVRVFHTDSKPSPGPTLARSLAVPPGAAPLSLSDGGGWQTVFRGNADRPYRVACSSGVLHVALDGDLVEEVHPGQSVDLEGKLIRVQAAAAATGWYRRMTIEQPGNSRS